MTVCQDCGLPTHTMTLDSGMEIELCVVCDEVVSETLDDGGGE